MSDLRNILPGFGSGIVDPRAGSRRATARKRPARVLAGLAVLALGSLLLSGCGGSGEPREYDEDVMSNYVKGCQISIEEDDPNFENAQDVCECAFGKIVFGDDYEAFMDLDAETQEDIFNRGVDSEKYRELDAELRESIQERGIDFDAFKELDDELREDIEALSEDDEILSNDSNYGGDNVEKVRRYISDCITGLRPIN